MRVKVKLCRRCGSVPVIDNRESKICFVKCPNCGFEIYTSNEFGDNLSINVLKREAVLMWNDKYGN